MRITPVNNNFRKINFGMFDNKKTEELTHDMLMKEHDYFDEDEKQEQYYLDCMAYIKDNIHYLDTSRLFTMKSKEDNEGEDVLYITMNQDEINKHEHKELFNEMINKYKDIYNPSKKDYLPMHIETAQNAGVLEEEGFLKILGDGEDIEKFCHSMQDKEQGIVPKEPEPRPTVETSDDDYDPDSDEARFEKLRDFVIYGSL